MSNTNQPQNTEEEKKESKDAPKGNKKQEQSDPQLTELRGFVNPSEDIEPTLSDGTKSPDKADENK